MLEAADAIVSRPFGLVRWIRGPAVALACYLLLALPHLRADGPLWFVHLGDRFVHAASTSSVISPRLGWTSPIGYDGQFYFGLAVDPVHARDYIAPLGVQPGYAYSRPLYPVLARLLGLGRVEGVAYAMFLINLAAVVLGTLAVVAWLRRRGLSDLYALLFGLFPAVVFSVSRDLTEPLAYALAAAAFLAFDGRTRRGIIYAAVLLAFSVLTRETTAVFAIGLGLALVAADRRTKRGLAVCRRGCLFLAATMGPLLAWKFLLRLWLGGATQERPGSGFSSLIPFHAYAEWWPWQPMRTVVVLVVLVPTIIAAGALVGSVRRSDEKLPLFLFFANALIFVAYLPRPVLVDYGAAGRAAIGVVLALIYCMPTLKTAHSRLAVAVAWSPLWYICAVLVLGAAAAPPLMG